MKKKLSFMFCLVILIAISIPVIAAAPVYSDMTDTELWDNYSELTREMISRGLLTEDDVVFTADTASFNDNDIIRTKTTTKKYVLNTNTHKIHRPECSSVKEIKDKNREDVEGDINKWLNKGYEKCKKCNPQ